MIGNNKYRKSRFNAVYDKLKMGRMRSTKVHKVTHLVGRILLFVIGWCQLKRRGLKGIQEIQGARNFIDANHLSHIELNSLGDLRVQQRVLDCKKLFQCFSLFGGREPLQIANSESMKKTCLA